MSVVDKIFGHGIIDEIIMYRVRWYGHSVKDCTYEQESHILEHFVKRYWKLHIQKRVHHGRKLNHIDNAPFQEMKRGGIGRYFAKERHISITRK